MIQLKSLKKPYEYYGCEGFQIEHTGEKSSDVYLIDGGNHFIAKGMPQINLSIILETFELLKNAPELLEMVDRLTLGISNAINTIEKYDGNKKEIDELKSMKSNAVKLLNTICSKTF